MNSTVQSRSTRTLAALVGATLLVCVGDAVGDTHYVSPSGAHQAPFTSWGTAATNIQAAIPAASDGDTVLVTNGVYDTGGAVVHGSLTNRVAITKAITVRSVNGPDSTFIKGSGPHGDTAVRCAYVGDGARLEGFTLTNGFTRMGSADEDTECSGGGAWCRGSAVVSTCTITGNLAAEGGGGIRGGIVQNCTIAGNSALSGGGVIGGDVRNCTISGNSAELGGGGTFESTVQNSTIIGNAARSGGGAYDSILLNCAIFGNSAFEPPWAGSGAGGGTFEGTVKNCIISGNSAQSGGGTSGGAIQNCTITRNTAYLGGGTSGGIIQNCIVYYNSAPNGGANWHDSTVEYSCTIPDPGGVGNITNAPGIAGISNPLLLPGSPCIDAGINRGWMATAGDFDGEPRIENGTVDMGCDEFHPGGLTGTLAVAISAESIHVTVGYPIEFETEIRGQPSGYEWRWGDDGARETAPWTRHTFGSPGDHEVVLEAWNPDGTASATLTIHVVAGFTNYVSPSGCHAAPYDTWATAATNIQAAIDVAAVGGVVLVTNGVYDSGGAVIHGSLTNRIALTNAVTVRGVNGPGRTFIVGSGPLGDSAVRCAYLGDRSHLDGFTLTNGHTRAEGAGGAERSGGGVWCEPSAVVSSCTISGSEAEDSGGGVFQGTVRNCTISGNAAAMGGGTYDAMLEDCILSRNSVAGQGGGAYGGTLRRCVITENEATFPHYGWGSGGGVCDAIVQDCTISANSAAAQGGGACGGVVQGCTITGNSAWSGGGVEEGDVRNCTIAGNRAEGRGGGTDGATVQNCTITGNEAEESGGGAYDSTLLNCVITGNEAESGGGTSGGTLRNCIIAGNLADTGGGVFESTVTNCTITGNLAEMGGGAYDSTVRNSIVYDNLVVVSGANWYGGTAEHTCTTPDPGGVGNIAIAPQFRDPGASDFRLMTSSLCIDAAVNQAWMAEATDLDGVQRIVNAAADMGAYESLSPVITDIMSSSNGLVITWHSVSNMAYAVYGDSHLVDGLDVLQDRIPATPPFNTYTDAVGGVATRSYAIEVQP